jgi:hypothetical protein
MVMQTVEMEEHQVRECGCGRSPSGRCVGWHSLSEDEYQARLEQHTQESMELKDSPLTESGNETNQ